MNSPVETKNRSGLGGWILVSIVAGFLVVGLCVALYWREASQIATALREREITRLNLFDQVLHRSFKETANDVHVLADGDGLRAYLSSGQQSDLDRAIHRAVFLS